MMKYLLSTGKVTTKLEYYVIDLFKLYLNIFPGDVPGDKTLGFDFNLSNTFKADLEDEVRSKVLNLLQKVQNRFTKGSVVISLQSCDIVNEELVKLVINVNNIDSEEIVVNLYN